MKCKCYNISTKHQLFLLTAMIAILFTLMGCEKEKNLDKKPHKPVMGDASPSPAAGPPFRHETSVSPAKPVFNSMSGAKAGEKGTKVVKKEHPKVVYKAGEDPEFAKACGWPVKCSAPLQGSILPSKRIVAFYGNPLSKKMGVLGAYPKEEMLRRLKREVLKWEKADPDHPVQPALHLIAVVAQGVPGKAGMYRMVMPDEITNRIYGWARETRSIMFIDIQTGHEDIRAVLPRFEWLLKNPDVHLGIDPEFNLVKSCKIPGTKIGTYDAADINYASEFLNEMIKKYRLPPKILIVHRFTQDGVTNASRIILRPEVQMVMNMDGWGAPSLKRSTYKSYIVKEPVQYTGFKLFYHNDTKMGCPLMTPKDVLKLAPKPLYIQYQ